ncbi:hypothetical protein COLO4_37429 [Corchorus olitorius]|uniref:Uncharacterized protein n=1 Tax=Corchorus olitorius TaxID=93759 RepID=A0A1R3G1V1_9ROSI|nr:hypothetical protein COLO4_37429 [Corchorus olitorius]
MRARKMRVSVSQSQSESESRSCGGPRPREKLRVSPGKIVKREGEKNLTSVKCVRLLWRRDCAVCREKWSVGRPPEPSVFLWVENERERGSIGMEMSCEDKIRVGAVFENLFLAFEMRSIWGVGNKGLSVGQRGFVMQ